MIRKRIIGPLVCLAIVGTIAGCRNPRVADSTSMTIVPGVGISNVVAIGMTLKQMKARSGDLTLTVEDYMNDKKWVNAAIPSLGVSFGNVYNGNRAPFFGWINFDIASEPTQGQMSFRGSLLGGPSFAKTGGVSREEIVARFGTPHQTLSDAKDFPRFMSEGTSFAFVSTNADLLYYTAEGIMFALKDGRLVRVAVCPKQTGRTTGGTVRR